LQLQPFGEETLRHFIYVERPEDRNVRDAPGYASSHPQPATLTRVVVVPAEQEYPTVNHLYQGIEANLRQLVAKYGEDKVFIGPARAQATTVYFQFDGLAPVTNLEQAIEAIDLIVAEGEGNRDNVADSHFGKFSRILDEYLALKLRFPDFVSARPVLANPFVEQPADSRECNLVDDPYTVRVNDLCNAVYETPLQLLVRFFSHTEETDAELKTLIDSAITAMFSVLKPLAETLTRLPAGTSAPGMTAGPSFTLYRSGYVLPHKRAAWLLLHERLRELTMFCSKLEDDTASSTELSSVRIALWDLTEAIGRHLGASH
jgi:hypothetical protein